LYAVYTYTARVFLMSAPAPASDRRPPQRHVGLAWAGVLR